MAVSKVADTSMSLSPWPSVAGLGLGWLPVAGGGEVLDRSFLPGLCGHKLDTAPRQERAVSHVSTQWVSRAVDIHAAARVLSVPAHAVGQECREAEAK